MNLKQIFIGLLVIITCMSCNALAQNKNTHRKGILDKTIISGMNKYSVDWLLAERTEKIFNKEAKYFVAPAWAKISNTRRFLIEVFYDGMIKIFDLKESNKFIYKIITSDRLKNIYLSNNDELLCLKVNDEIIVYDTKNLNELIRIDICNPNYINNKFGRIRNCLINDLYFVDDDMTIVFEGPYDCSDFFQNMFAPYISYNLSQLNWEIPRDKLFGKELLTDQVFSDFFPENKPLNKYHGMGGDIVLYINNEKRIISCEEVRCTPKLSPKKNYMIFPLFNSEIDDNVPPKSDSEKKFLYRNNVNNIITKYCQLNNKSRYFEDQLSSEISINQDVHCMKYVVYDLSKNTIKSITWSSIPSFPEYENETFLTDDSEKVLIGQDSHNIYLYDIETGIEIYRIDSAQIVRGESFIEKDGKIYSMAFINCISSHIRNIISANPALFYTKITKQEFEKTEEYKRRCHDSIDKRNRYVDQFICDYSDDIYRYTKVEDADQYLINMIIDGKSYKNNKIQNIRFKNQKEEYFKILEYGSYDADEESGTVKELTSGNEYLFKTSPKEARRIKQELSHYLVKHVCYVNDEMSELVDEYYLIGNGACYDLIKMDNKYPY